MLCCLKICDVCAVRRRLIELPLGVIGRLVCVTWPNDHKRPKNFYNVVNYGRCFMAAITNTYLFEYNENFTIKK